MFIDSHTHLFDTKFDSDRAEVIANSISQGVTKFILPATGDAEHELMFDTVRQFPDNCCATIGLHPMEMNDNEHWREQLAKVEWYLQNPPVRIVAIGEVGLDLYWDKGYLSEQLEALEFQIELSIVYDLPLIIHTRDAWHEILPVIEKYSGRIRGVFHSFAGGVEEIERIEKIGGFYYGINGTVTYKNSVLPESLKLIGVEKILLETDSPYLPPVPYRGKRNESSYIPLIGSFVASLKGLRSEELAKITTANATELFKL